MALTGAELVTRMRSVRGLTMSGAARLAGVAVSTISRIESGEMEPTVATLGHIAAELGFVLDATVLESGSDEPIAEAVARLTRARPEDRGRVLAQFPEVGRLAPVAKRRGARRVEFAESLLFGAALALLEQEGRSPLASSLEAALSSTGRTMSFNPVIYVDDPSAVRGLPEANPRSFRVAFLLPTTDNVRANTGGNLPFAAVTREWALLDALASPGRQADVARDLLPSFQAVAA
ncbi:MAG: helix-turn-helix transcriptional regulator [Bifidobacteriaceae bacterium]|jgi:transcriptional regulator with XRE-family HTH domain|nr:helix-turn-helix transcriptional regulator [Bifidobacteriaceae bacterium]